MGFGLLSVFFYSIKDRNKIGILSYSFGCTSMIIFETLVIYGIYLKLTVN
jgi:hypothetical protein